MIVVKFGGLTLDTLEKKEKSLRLIKEYLEKFDKVIIVTSAFGRRGDPYSTDTFLDMTCNMSIDYQKKFSGLGEIISSTMYANYLLENNYKVKLLGYDYLDLKTFDLMVDFKKILLDYDIIVVPGFIGELDGKLMTMDRGGSNISASLISYHLYANLVIISNIDGIYNESPVKDTSKKLLVTTVDEIKSIFPKENSFLPNMAIELIDSKRFVVLFRSLDDENGTFILNI